MYVCSLNFLEASAVILFTYMLRTYVCTYVNFISYNRLCM